MFHSNMDITPLRLPLHYIINDDELEYILKYGYPGAHPEGTGTHPGEGTAGEGRGGKRGRSTPTTCTSSVISTVAFFDTTALACTDPGGEGGAIIPELYMSHNYDGTHGGGGGGKVDVENIFTSDLPLPSRRHLHSAGTFKRKFSQGECSAALVASHC